MTRLAVGRRRSHPFDSFYISRWAATTGQSASAVCSRAATLVRMSVRPRCSYGDGVGAFGRFTSVHRWNQTCARLSARRESGAATTQGNLKATACSNAKTSSQLYAVVANVSVAAILAEACFALPGFLASAASIVMTLSSLLASSASLKDSVSDAYSVMERAKIFRSSPAYDSPWRIAASVKNGGRSTALQEFQSQCFLDHARSPAAARRITSAIGRQIFSPSTAKAISMLNKITEGDLRSPAREKATMDSPSDLLPTAA